MSDISGNWKLHSHRFNGEARHLEPSGDLEITRDANVWTFKYKAGGRERSPTLVGLGPVTEFDVTDGDGEDALTIKGKPLIDAGGREVILGLVHKPRTPGGIDSPGADVFLAVRTGGVDGE